MIKQLIRDIDKEIFLFMNSSHWSVLDHLMFSYRNLFLWTLLLILSVFLYRNFRKSKKRSTGLVKLMLICYIVVIQIILSLVVLPYIFSFLVHVERPVYNEDFSNIKAFDDFNYLSKDVFFAARICAITAISFFFIAYKETPKWLKALLFLWILLVSYNRIYTGAFYPSSILISALAGTVIGLFAYRYYYHLKNFVFVI